MRKILLLILALSIGISDGTKAETYRDIDIPQWILDKNDENVVNDIKSFIDACLFTKSEYCPSIECDISTHDMFLTSFNEAKECFQKNQKIDAFYDKLLLLDSRIQEYRKIENKVYEAGKKICHPHESYLPNFSELAFIENYERRKKSIHRYAETNVSDMSITLTEQYIRSVNACIDDMNEELENSNLSSDEERCKNLQKTCPKLKCDLSDSKTLENMKRCENNPKVFNHNAEFDSPFFSQTSITGTTLGYLVEYCQYTLGWGLSINCKGTFDNVYNCSDNEGHSAKLKIEENNTITKID